MFAKLFATPHGQLLVTKILNDDDNPALTLRGNDVDGIGAEISCAYHSETERDGVFDSFDQAEADKNAEWLRSSVDRFMGA